MKHYKQKLDFLLNHKVYGPFGNYDGLLEIYFTTDQADTPEGKAEFFKIVRRTQEKINSKRADFSEIITHTQSILDILESCEEEKDERILLDKLAQMIKLYNE